MDEEIIFQLIKTIVMKVFNKSVLFAAALLMAVAYTSCKDANEYGGAQTDNPSWISNYTDSALISHPESLAGSVWVRGSGLKKNAYGQEVQGFVESMDFFAPDSVTIKMSEGTTSGTWVDESGTYECTYSEVTGKLEVLKRVVDDKGKVSKTVIFTGIAVQGNKEVLTVSHYGDTPVQTYLVRR